MERTLRILVVGNDAPLHPEFESACAGVPNLRPVIYFANGYPTAIDIAVSRNPHLICVQLTRDPRELASFAREIQIAVPQTTLAALYHPAQLVAGDSESSVLIELLRVRVQDFLRRPLSSTELRQLFDRLLTPRASTRPVLGKVLSFVSNKGGVGKSTIAVNTACELARRYPGQVLLIDASLQLGICAFMLNAVPTTTLLDAVREKDRLDETLLERLTISHSCGLRLLAAPADAVEASEIDDASLSQILNLARRTFQYVIVDTFPLLDNAVISILDLSDLSFIVSQGTAPSIVGTGKLLPVLEGIGLPRERQRLVLNQNHWRFPGRLTPADMESRLGRPLDYIFPYQRRLMISMNTGAPFVLRANPYFGFRRVIRELVQDAEAHRLAEHGQTDSAALPAEANAVVTYKEVTP